MKRKSDVLMRCFIGLCGLIVLLLGSPVVAQSGVAVTANVLSGVSPEVSTFVSDILQLPADDKSVVILTATIFSKEGKTLPNKEVVVSSNRGDVDTILCYSGSTLTNARTTVTDSEGKARCASSSEVPGNSTFTAVAEGITLDNKPTVTFTPLPFLTNLTIKINLPGGGQLTILEPAKPKPSKPANERLVNTDVELQIPFWVLLVIILFFLTEPILIILILRLSHKVRRGFAAEKLALAKEQELLAKIYQLESQVVQTASAIEQEVRQIESSVDLARSEPSATAGLQINQPLTPTPIVAPLVPPQGPDTGQGPPTQ
ncbi:MAG: Ig-like domain-containing protein [bacterium]|nr:Ig-like domain-containing protein [bacterium]